MSFLAAVLLLNMEPSDAFICFANLLNKPCQLAFFRVDHPMVSSAVTKFAVHFLQGSHNHAWSDCKFCEKVIKLKNYFPGLTVLSPHFFMNPVLTSLSSALTSFCKVCVLQCTCILTQ